MRPAGALRAARVTGVAADASARLLDPAVWAQLGPLLDELLELDVAARAEKLAEWRARDPRIANELKSLLETARANEAERFLEEPLLPALPAVGAGSVCGAWTLERLLGTGGMGSVWLAKRTDGRYNAQAAIKLPHPSVLEHGSAERFEREGRLLARVSHPQIAALLDAGVAASGQPYLVLEYVQGEPIDRYCDGKRLGVAERIELFADVVTAVAHAHGQLVLHRDLKPSNILVDATGRVKLLDFGIAKLIEADPHATAAAAASTRVFTPDHVAPEQLQGEPVGTACDVYALGVLLYQLLAGSHPTAQPGHTPVQRLRAVIEAAPAPMSDAAQAAGAELCALRGASPRQLWRALRGDLDTIAAKALKKNPAERYAGAAALAEDLNRWRNGQPLLARPDSAGYRLRLFVRRHRFGVGATAAAAVLLLAAGAVSGWQAVVARHERDEARWQAERALARSTLYNLLLGQMGQLDAPLTQRQILDGAVQLVQSRYGSRPRLAVELLLPIAGQYQTMGDANADLSVMQIAARMAAASGEAELVADTACSTVDTYLALNRPAEAEAALATARAAIRAIAAPNARVEATCWRYEAQLAHEQGQRERALATALSAKRRLESGGGTDSNADSNVYWSLLSLLIYIHRENGDPAAALATVDQLAEYHRSMSRGRTLDSALVDRSRAVLLADAGEIVAALGLVREIIARFDQPGVSVPQTLLFDLAQFELAADHTARSHAAIARAQAAGRALATTEHDARPAYAKLLVALAEGDTRDARRRLDELDRSPERRALGFVTHTLGAARARLLLAEGRTVAAVDAIETELTRIEKAGIANLARRADAWRTAAEILLAAGDPARAAAHAQAAIAASTRAARNADASAHVGHGRLLLARARRAAGDSAGARTEAARAAGSLARGLGADHRLTLEARSLAAVP